MGHPGVQEPWHVQKHFVGTWEVSRPPRCRARPQRKKESSETNDEKPREVRLGHSSREAGEQGAATLRGASGAKGRGQGKFGKPQHEPRTEAGNHVTRGGPDTASYEEKPR